MKKFLAIINLSIIIFFGVVVLSQATIIETESILPNSSPTKDLWQFLYFAPNPNTSYVQDWANSTSDFSGATSQGYLTGVGARSNVDHFESYSAAFKSTYVFTTYVKSLIGQTVTLAAGGDDGHSIFVDNQFKAGAPIGVSAIYNLNMVAGQIYKLTNVGNNWGGHFELWSNIKGGYDSSTGQYGWTGPLSDANNILMDASGNFDAVPEPATMLLFGLGLLGLAGVNRRKK